MYVVNHNYTSFTYIFIQTRKIDIFFSKIDEIKEPCILLKNGKLSSIRYAEERKSTPWPYSYESD